MSGISAGEYWWSDEADERFWVEIRREPGIGLEVFIPTRNSLGNKDPRWELVRGLSAGQRVLHYHARESRFIGVSTVAAAAYTADGTYRAPLTDFVPIDASIGLTEMRDAADSIYSERDALLKAHPGRSLYLPFQFTQDRRQFRMLSNYFAKLPISIIELIFESSSDSLSQILSHSPRNARPARTAFLQPFRAKADTSYSVQIEGGLSVRTRDHETLVNDCANWLSDRGLTPVRNAVVDLAVDTPRVIIEAKLAKAGISTAVREALGQLYEYRYFRVVDPAAALVLLIDAPIDSTWIRYLEDDRSVGVIWRDSTGAFVPSRLAGTFLDAS